MELEQKIAGIVKGIKNAKSWYYEVKAFEAIIEQLEANNKVASVRDLAAILEKPKTWVGTTMLLMRGLRQYPEMEKLHNRNQAYSFLREKDKRLKNGYRY